MKDIETFTREIQQHIPGIQVTDDPEVLRDSAVDGLMPRLVITPSNAEEMGQAVALLSQYNLTMLTRGGGSRLHMGAIPEPFDVLLETSKLTRLLEHNIPEQTCRAEAGIKLADLQTQLASRGQWLPLDPPEPEEATIGGLLATNASGPKRLRYGTARDLVTHLLVVQASGHLAGNHDHENKYMHDLYKFYVGSLGTLGIIVEAGFTLLPLPACERTLLLTFASSQDIVQTVQAIQDTALTPSAMEIIDSGAANDLSALGGLQLPANGYTLALNFEGPSLAVERALDEARVVARTHGALLGDDLTGTTQEIFWRSLRNHLRGTVTCKAAILISRMDNYLQKLTVISQRYELETAVIAHAGNGILYIELRPADASSRLIQAIIALRQLAQEARGSLVVERCPVDLKRQIDVWGNPGASFRFMQRLKHEFDPKGTFVKGRFVGGL